MIRGPGFLDDPHPDRSPPANPNTLPAHSSAHPTGPILFNAEPSGTADGAGKIDQEWNPRFLRGRSRAPSSLMWITGGIFTLIGSWLLLSLGDFLLDQFHRSTSIGILSLGLFGISSILLGFGVFKELRAWGDLRHVDVLRKTLDHPDIGLAKLRSEIVSWINDIRQQIANPDQVISRITANSTRVEMVSILRNEVVRPLDKAARDAGVRAALKGGVLVAIVPAPALEGAIAGVRSLLLVRSVALAYGIRPGFIVTMVLLRRIAGTMVGVAATAALSHGVAEAALRKIPGMEEIFSAVPEASVAAVRLYRLARAVSEACSPISLSTRS